MTPGSLALEMKPPERFDDEENKQEFVDRDYSKELKLLEEEEAKDDNADMRFLLTLNYPALTLILWDKRGTKSDC